jgi:hypothetical protein
MKWLPYENLTIVTNLSPDIAQADLENEVSPNNTLILFPRFRRQCDGSFLGGVADGAFRIRPQTVSRNLFLPNISGTISPGPGGSSIQLKMRIHPLAPLVIFAWIALTSMSGMIILSTNPNVHFGGFATLVGTLLIIGYVSILYGFAMASRKAAKILADILQGDIKGA